MKEQVGFGKSIISLSQDEGEYWTTGETEGGAQTQDEGMGM